MMGGNPQQLAEQALLSNPAFADFVKRNSGKTPEQIAQENGLDFDLIKRTIG